jgi:4-amino-4-deoxy-L-arabinose transferase-like glycosyltransferase
MPRPASATSSPRLPLWLACLIVIGVASLLCLPFLSASGLSHAEGQRVQPAWAMLEATRAVASREGISPLGAFFTRESLDAWLVPRLFEQAYLRKPPGTPWAIAIFGAMFGESNAAARAVSGCALVLMSVLTALTAARWFAATARERGPVALVGGLAAALLPAWYWYPPLARSAEIESLNHLWTFIASMAIIELALAPRHVLGVARVTIAPAMPRTIAWCGVLALSTAMLTLTKGPASIPVLAGVGMACVVARRGLLGPSNIARVPATRRAWGLVPVCVGLVLGALAFWAWSVAARAVLARTGETPITQEVGEFLFSPARVLEILALPLAALATALPHSLAMIRFAGSPEITGVDPSVRVRHALARALCVGVVLSILAYMCVGVSNNRYVLPAMTLLPLVVAGGWWRAVRLHESKPGEPSPVPRFAWTGVVLLVLAIGLAIYGERRRENRTSGEPDATKLGLVLEGPAELWGDALMDMRPEIAMRAARDAADRGESIRVRWTPHLLVPAGGPPVPPVGSYLLIRTDRRGGTNELDAYRNAGLLLDADSSFQAVFSGKAHNFEYLVYRRMR